MLARIKAATEYIRSVTNFEPEIGIILGTGLGKLAEEIQVDKFIDYADIPDFPVSTVESHKGRFIFGKLSGKSVVAMQGRFHFYEGYTMKEVVLPVQVMKLLGIKTLLISNASGALTPGFCAGDLVIINDHINLQPDNPLRGTNISSLGPRFPDMSNAYDPALICKLIETGKMLNIDLKSGVYVSVPGPMLETQAEYRYLRIIGGDIVGMSTVPEILAARHMGIPCLAISVVTDEGWHDVLQPVTLEQVIAAAGNAEPKLAQVLKELVKIL
jgi:purine-nucleoside phosphorylase